jgi:hypothetical protein
MADGSDDDDAMPEEPVVSPSGMKMPLQMGGLGRQSGSQLFEEEDEAIKGGEVTLNIADESKEIQLKVGQCTVPRPWLSHTLTALTSRVAVRSGADR